MSSLVAASPLLTEIAMLSSASMLLSLAENAQNPFHLPVFKENHNWTEVKAEKATFVQHY